jgi:hypothetical protein
MVGRLMGVALANNVGEYRLAPNVLL